MTRVEARSRLPVGLVIALVIGQIAVAAWWTARDRFPSGYEVCEHLLSPFPRLEASLRKLAEEHGLRDVEKPALKAALALLDEAPQAIPEGVPPPGFEPEPEPMPDDWEPEPEPEPQCDDV